MSSSGQTKRKLLELPFGRKKPRHLGPGPTSASSNNTPCTTISSNVQSGSLTIASGSTSNLIANSSGPAHATRSQPPNPEPPAIPVPVKNEAFQKAVQEYIDTLSDDDKAAFQSDTDVMKKLEELQQSKSRLFISHPTLMQRVHKVLQCMKQFMGSIAICIQHQPQISSLVVGGLHCILTLALGYFDFFGNLTDKMELIGSHLPYLPECSRAAFENSEIQEALVAVYRNLLDFYVKVRGILVKKESKAAYLQGFKLFLRYLWEPFEDEFKSIEKHFLNNATAVYRLVMMYLANAKHQMDANDKKIQERREDERQDEERRKILRWLSPDDFEQTHEKHLKKRFGKTGQWLVDDPRFINWRSGALSSLLWCHGAPGSGKTVLASLVIDDLSGLYELSPDAGVTFIYCNYKEPRTSEAYIKLAIKQICRRMKHFPHQLHEIFKTHYRNDSQPTSDELRSIFLAITLQLKRTFLVLDALDECTLDQRAELCRFFFDIIESNTSPTPARTSQGIVKLFVTSRKEHDIERVFQQKSLPTIEIEAAKVDRDIAVYTKAQIDIRLQDHRLRIQNMALKSKIFDALITKAGGMFLWVEFQLDSICAQDSDNAIAKALESVPEDMDATYVRILDAINKKPRNQRELARRALICIAYARSPLPISILAYAVSIEYDTESMDTLKSSIPTENAILNACSNLVSIDRNTREVRFVHFSVQEFLISGRSQSTFRDDLAHRELARIFVTFLSILDCQSLKAFGESGLLLETLNDWPFHVLAANLNLLPKEDPLVVFVSSFLGSSPPMFINGWNPTIYVSFSPSVLALMFNLPSRDQHCQAWSFNERVFNFIINYKYSRIIRDHGDCFAMHYATSTLDSISVAARLYAHGYPINHYYKIGSAVHLFGEWGFYSHCILNDYEIPTNYDLPPLFLAKSEKLAIFLLDNGASTDSHFNRIGFIDPLLFFARKCSAKVTQVLLNKVVDQDGARCGFVLCSAVSNPSCSVECIQQLLNKGANVNGGIYGNLLHDAAANRGCEVVEVLIGNGADVNVQGGYYGNALQAAVYRGEPEVVQLLLGKGADVNAQGGYYGNALQAAARRGNLRVVKLLLDKGAGVNAQGGSYGNALQAAIYRGDPGVVQLLLDKGAGQGGYYGNALQIPAIRGDAEMVQLLLDKGADVNDGNALKDAVLGSHFGVVKLLLDKGADANARGGSYGNVLQAAACCGYIEVVQLFLDKGADANAQGGHYGNALQAAAYACRGHRGIVQLLLDNRADVNAQGGYYGNALQAAAYRGHREVVQLLLANGADVNAQGGYYGNALQAAAYCDHREMVQLLLDKGADVNAQGGHYGNALRAAAIHGYLEVVQLLLDKGADVNAPSGFYSTALHFASTPAIKRLLLDYGAAQ